MKRDGLNSDLQESIYELLTKLTRGTRGGTNYKNHATFPFIKENYAELMAFVVASPEVSAPPSGDPLEYIVASFPSKMKRNHPLEPLDSSKAAASDQM